MSASPTPITLEGSIDKVFFRAESGFSALSIRLDDGTRARACGQAPLLKAGERVSLMGSYENDKRFGKQLRIQCISVSAPTTDAGLAASLVGLVPGLGHATAKKLVARLGGAEAAIQALDQDHETVRTVIGAIASGGYASMGDQLLYEWETRRAERELDAQLASLEIQPGVRSKIIQRYQGRALEVIRQNPYLLAEEVPGIGFSTADEIARSTGYVGQDDLVRARAVVRRVLHDAAQDDGHTYLSKMLLNSKFCSLAPEGWTDVAAIIQAALTSTSSEFHVDPVSENTALVSIFADETSIAESTRTLLNTAADNDALVASSAAVEMERLGVSTGISLSPSQESAIFQVIAGRVAVLTGGPGTGKTTIVKTLCALYEQVKMSVALCAPTGRAARRLSEATERSGKTIHKLLEWGPVIGGPFAAEESVGFRRDENNPLDADVVICDESSMLDVPLMAALLRALKRTARILFVGDIDQLPPVGPGAPFRDLIESKLVAIARLTEIHRQAAGSGIVRASHSINEGYTFAPNPKGDRSSGAIFIVECESPEEIQQKIVSIVASQLPKALGLSPFDDIQVIVPMRKHETGTEQLNALIQERINPREDGEEEIVRSERSFRQNDRVMQTSNNYALGVMNGQIGRIEAVRPQALDGERAIALRVVFEGGPVDYAESEVAQLRHAYACTCHKMQGSQAKAVVVGLSKPHWYMLNRTLLYTAVTRAEQVCIIVCDKRSLIRAIRNKGNFQRATMLPNLLVGG
jgi:exodeoxyribonuclease V alpha subunit